MFCSSIRRRPSFAAVIPKLQAQDGMALREHKLIAHDLNIPLQTNTASTSDTDLPARRLRVILVSPSCVTALEAATKRIEHFALLTGHQDLTIIFLLNPPHNDTTFSTAKQVHASSNPATSNDKGMKAYTSLRAHLFNTTPSVLSIPMLPLYTLDGLPDLLKRRVAELTRPPPLPPVKKPTALQLLRLCTAAGTLLSQDTTNMLSDIFPDLRSLVRACITAGQGQEELGSSLQPIDVDDGSGGQRRVLRDLVGEEEYRDIVDFWRDEYIVQ